MFFSAKHVLVFILVHITATAKTKAEAEGGISRGYGCEVGCCSCGLVEGFQREDYAQDCDLQDWNGHFGALSDGG